MALVFFWPVFTDCGKNHHHSLNSAICAAKASSRTKIGSMSSSTHGRTMHWTGSTLVPSYEKTPCSLIQSARLDVVTIDCGDHGVVPSASSTKL